MKLTPEKVKVFCERLKVVQEHKRSRANMNTRPLELNPGDKVYLRILPLKIVMRFGKSSK